MIRSSIALVILLGLGLGLAQARVNEPPAGLTVVDWTQIRALYEQHRHTATLEDDGSYVARNPRQGWEIRFDGRGFTVRPDEGDWSWGLELVSFGVEDAQQAINGEAAVRAEHGRVSYGWRPELEEWFVNDTRGLEHGWTVKRKPQGAGEGLELELAVRGGLRPEVEGTDGSAVRFVDEAGAAVIRYAGLNAWDADGVELPSRLEVDLEDRVLVLIDDGGARYPITVDPIAQQAYLKASNTSPSDWFGFSVAISDDTVVVGAPYESGSGTGVDPPDDNGLLLSGAAYVFERTAGVWSQQAYLKASNPGSGDEFGFSVAVSGDTVVVGAMNEAGSGTGVDPMDNDIAYGSGAAYVFQRTTGTWAQQAYLKASNTGSFDNFGFSVAVSGDRVVVGAINEAGSGTGVDPPDDNLAVHSGAAYVFERLAGSWSQEAYLKASNGGLDDRFGYSVSVSGDTVVVGAVFEAGSGTGVDPPDDNGASDSGAAYVFERTGGLWSQQAYLKASNTGTGDQFGFSVAVSGDTVVVGAILEAGSGTGVDPTDDNLAVQSGAAYVFERTAGSWSQQNYIKASNTGAADQFGRTVAVSGDTVVVGARGEDSSGTGVNPPDDNSAPSSGAVYVFDLRNPTTTTIGLISPSPGRVGISYIVAYSVTAAEGTPTGSVAISDGIDSNTCTVAAGSCPLVSTTGGGKTITVTYLGSADFAPSGGSATQTVDPAPSASTVVSINPSPSTVGAPYTVAYSVTSAGGTPTGSVTVSDGTASNTCTVAAGSCSLSSPSAGAKTITISYLGDGSFDASADAGAQTVNPAPTTTTVGTPSPAFPLLGEPYSVPHAVSSAGGTPTGSVTVSDGTASNTCTVADASCSLISATLGVKTLSVSYLGDGNFAPSSGTGAVQVCSYALSPASNALTAVGGTGAILVTAPSGCPWAANESLPWLSIVSGASGVGTGTIGYQVDSNSSVLGRSGDIAVADQTHTVTQSGVPCTYSVTPPTNSLGAVGGSGAIFVTTPPSCVWTVSESLSWVTIISGASGSGNGTVAYEVTPFAQAGVRQGDITVAGKTHAITQAGGATLAAELGAFTNGAWFLDRDGDFGFDGASEISGWGSPGDIPVNGDWNGDGFRDLGVFSNGTWFLDRNGDAAFDPATEIQGWGAPGWIPVTGDWNGDGKTDVGAVDPSTSTWFLDLNGDFAFDPVTEIRGWGSPGDTPVVGDWDGDGDDDIGVFSGGTWFIDFNGDGGFQLATDQRGWGVAGWIPVVGDWNGDGADEIGAIEPTSMAWFRDVNGDFLFDPVTELIGWGSPGDQPVVADWNGDGSDDVGVFSGGVWFIDAAGDGAFDPATDIRGWGVAGWTPVPGAWQ